MEIHHSNDNSLILSEIEPFVLEVLRLIPRAADPRGDAAATSRIYQPPMEHADPEFSAEWAEFVHSDLRHLFESAVATVTADLGGADPELGIVSPVITIREKHFDAWLNALNQARLGLAERHRFSEEELEATGSNTIGSDRELALFQIHFYGLLQELILRAMHSAEFPEDDDEEASAGDDSKD